MTTTIMRYAAVSEGAVGGSDCVHDDPFRCTETVATFAPGPAPVALQLDLPRNRIILVGPAFHYDGAQVRAVFKIL